MDETMTLQGREITKNNIELVKATDRSQSIWRIAPGFLKSHASCEVGVLANGHIKDMACRTLLSKLELQGYITLPRRRSPGRGSRKVSIPYVLHNTASIACALSALKLVHVGWRQRSSLVSSSVYFTGTIIFRFSSTVGENPKYLVFDREHNPLTCLLFGSAAWKCALRDDFIGSRCQNKKGQSQIPDQ